MPDLTLVMLGAGSSSRFHQKVKKQWLRIGDQPLWLFSTLNLASLFSFSRIIVTASAEDLPYAQKFSDKITFVEGGASRQASLKNALLHVKTPYVLVSDIARPCIDAALLNRLLEQHPLYDCVVPYLSVVDTVLYQNKAINRDEVKLIQTPQLSNTALLKKALETNVEYTDDSSAIEAMGGKVGYVAGNEKAKKLTCKEDIHAISCLSAPSSLTFTGNGFDVHAFEDAKPMVLGGITIDSPLGFKAHSDGDVAIHALIDALLGAAGAGDIGEWFPDTSNAYKNIDSKHLLKEVVLFIERVGFEIVHCDLTIMAEYPKLGTLKNAMRFCLSELLHLSPQHLNIKATTTEKLGFIGRKEGVAVSATATLKYANWMNV